MTISTLRPAISLLLLPEHLNALDHLLAAGGDHAGERRQQADPDRTASWRLSDGRRADVPAAVRSPP